MVRQKIKPYRNSSFMRFAHQTMKQNGEVCCMCRTNPWTQLHHFGSGGGKGMKPSDLELCRMCKVCADKYEFKRTAMIRDGKWEILATMQMDALEINEEWQRFIDKSPKNQSRCKMCECCVDGSCCAVMSHSEPPSDCAVDELTEFLSLELEAMSPGNQKKWLLKWSNRRSANVIGFAVEALSEIARMRKPDNGIGDASFVASQTLKMSAIDIKSTPSE
jgi:hypothetical protein